MSFLNSLKPVLRGQTDITLRITREPDGVHIVVIPRLEGIEPETNDDELRHMQGVLSQPFTITIPFDADLDTELARNVDGYQITREPRLDALDAYRESVKRADADAAKRKADQAEADKVKKAAGKTTTKAAPAAKPEKAAPPPVEPVPDLFSLAASQTPQAAADTPANEPSDAEDDASSDTGTDDDTNTTDDNSED